MPSISFVSVKEIGEKTEYSFSKRRDPVNSVADLALKLKEASLRGNTVVISTVDRDGERALNKEELRSLATILEEIKIKNNLEEGVFSFSSSVMCKMFDDTNRSDL